MNFFAFRFYRYILTFFLLLIGADSFVLAASRPHIQDQSFTNLINDSCGPLMLPISRMRPTTTQTIAYLNKQNLQANLNFSYNMCVARVGKQFLQNLFASVIAREIEYADRYRVFYHGFDRTYILFQDIYSGLYSIVYKKILRDFVMLRIPDSDFNTFKNVNEFLRHHIRNGEIKNFGFDHIEHVKKRLLSVNPSLFGNTTYCGECTFQYFIDSHSVSGPSFKRLIKDVFKAFNYQTFFEKYKADIEELIDLLSDYEHEKTGGLLQIFVPESLVDSVAYKCRPYGLMAYDDEQPELHPASRDLDDYKRDALWADDSYDNIQFRLLINQHILNPNSGIKMFRYCNETEKTKQYNIKLKNLLDTMATDVREGLI